MDWKIDRNKWSIEAATPERDQKINRQKGPSGNICNARTWYQIWLYVYRKKSQRNYAQAVSSISKNFSSVFSDEYMKLGIIIVKCTTEEPNVTIKDKEE